MKQADGTSRSRPPARHSRRLRRAGMLALALGIAAAGLVYWRGTRAGDLSDQAAMAGFDRARMRQMGMLYGKMGPMLEQWLEDLKQPGTQAILIVVVSALVAAGCFYFARLLDPGDSTR